MTVPRFTEEERRRLASLKEDVRIIRISAAEERKKLEHTEGQP